MGLEVTISGNVLSSFSVESYRARLDKMKIDLPFSTLLRFLHH